MSNFIIGTAGHIDHGKTTLIRTLTGRNTDKLQEEIKRGISINLGFTYFDLPSGKRAGIIDVPGHERFVRNMIAGAVGIDLVMITVDANEGIMPQTVEHLDILSYLNISDAIFVITKCGLADELMIELVKEDIQSYIDASTVPFIKSAGIVPIDSLSGFGMDNLLKMLDDKSFRMTRKNEKASPRLNIDRVFSIKGFGTVVTGTMAEGTIRVGDELTAYPDGRTAKIRNIQVHDESKDEAKAGQRTALNLSDCKVSELKRGDVLAPSGLIPTQLIDVRMGLVNHTDIILKNHSRIRLCIGAREVMGRIIPIGIQNLSGGQEGYCRIRTEEPIVAKKGDRFVVRNYSPVITIGGGVVLDPNPPKSKTEDLYETLMVKEKGDSQELIHDFIMSSKAIGRNETEVMSYAGMQASDVTADISSLRESGQIAFILGRLYATAYLDSLAERILDLLMQFHSKFPLRKGMPKEQLYQTLAFDKEVKAKAFDGILQYLVGESVVKLQESLYVSVWGYVPTYTRHQELIRDEIEYALRRGRFSPPLISEIVKSKEYLEVLEERIPSAVLRLDNDYCIHREVYDEAFALLLSYPNEKITLAEFRDLLGTTRKYAVLILELFDKQKITRRLGDERIIQKQKI